MKKTYIQIILPLIAAVLYLVSLYLFLQGQTLGGIILISIHGILLILYALSFADKSTGEMPQDISADPASDNISSDNDDALAENEAAIEQLNNKISELQAANDVLKISVYDLEKELGETKKALEEASALSEDGCILDEAPSILPDVSDNLEEINIVSVAKDVSKEFADDALKAGLTINISTDKEDILVKADSSMIRTLFRNIVDNAIKYMNTRGSLIITISSIGDDIFVICKDNGEGLSAEETDHIFELNYQGSNRISGNGLGLYQAKAIVNYYGGIIYAKSTPGNGMGIYIQLPTV